MTLTPRQEAFAQAVASGKSQSDAYREAYPRSRNWKPETLWRRASEMMSNREVSARTESIRKDLAALSLWTREQSVETLKKVIEDSDRASDVVQAVRELNNMHGYHAPKKIAPTDPEGKREFAGGGLSALLASVKVSVESED